MSGEGSSPSPILDEGWIGPGGRKFVAVGIALIVLGTAAYYVSGGAEEIGDFFDKLAQEAGQDEGESSTTTLEDTTIESGEFPAPAEPEQPVDRLPAPAPGTPEDVEDQFEEARRQLECLADAPDAAAMTACVQPPGG